MASTAHVAYTILITTAGDLTHLDGHFVTLASYKPQ
jgi:hypothetical protein